MIGCLGSNLQTSVHSLLNNAISAFPDGHSTRVEPAAWSKCVEIADGSAMKFTWVPALDRFAHVLQPKRISEAESLHWPGAYFSPAEGVGSRRNCQSNRSGNAVLAV
jgi:hypothetical protein